MKKLIFAILLLASPLFASGPKYSYDDPKLNDEMSNIYRDLQFPNIVNGRASTMTVIQLNVSSLTISGATTGLSITSLNLTTGTIQSFMVVGDTTGNPPPLKRIGEIVSGTATGTSTTGVTSFVSINLTPGTWYVWSLLVYNGATGGTNLRCGISTVNNSFSGTTEGLNATWSALSSADGVGDCQNVRTLSVSTNQPVYLVEQMNAAKAVSGSISAMRTF